MWAAGLFLLLGGGALLMSCALAALVARRASWLGWQAFVGVFVAVLAWKIASSAGSFDDHSTTCTDCGESAFWGQVLLAGNIVGWLLGTGLGGLAGQARRRTRAAEEQPRP